METITLANFIKAFGAGDRAKQFAREFGNEMEATPQNLGKVVGADYNKEQLARMVTNKLTDEQITELAGHFKLEFCENCVARGDLKPAVATKLTNNRTKDQLLAMFVGDMMKQLEDGEEE